MIKISLQKPILNPFMYIAHLALTGSENVHGLTIKWDYIAQFQQKESPPKFVHCS